MIYFREHLEVLVTGMITALFGAAFATLASYFGWWLLYKLLWTPGWHGTLAGAIRINTLGTDSYLVVLIWPPIVGALFVASTLLCFTIGRRSKGLCLFFNLVPAVLIFIWLNPGNGWNFPFAETVVLLVGVGWTLLLHKFARTLWTFD